MLVRAGRTQVGANDKIRVGLIGCNGMGFSNLTAFLRNSEVECIALADIDQGVLDRRAADVEKMQGKKPQGLYKDWAHGQRHRISIESGSTHGGTSRIHLSG